MKKVKNSFTLRLLVYRRNLSKTPRYNIVPQGKEIIVKQDNFAKFIS